MKNIILFLFVSFSSFSFVLAQSDATANKELAKPTSDLATVYFYRVKEVNGLDNRNTKVKIEGKETFRMPQHRFIGLRLAPGKYGLMLRQKQSEMLLTVESGKTYFIRVSEKLAGFGFNQSLTEMPEEQAIYQMRDIPILEDSKIRDKIADFVKDKPIFKKE